jgi:hypothetical protein
MTDLMITKCSTKQHTSQIRIMMRFIFQSLVCVVVFNFKSEQKQNKNVKLLEPIEEECHRVQSRQTDRRRKRRRLALSDQQTMNPTPMKEQ